MENDGITVTQAESKPVLFIVPVADHVALKRLARARRKTMSAVVRELIKSELATVPNEITQAS